MSDEERIDPQVRGHGMKMYLLIPKGSYVPLGRLDDLWIRGKSVAVVVASLLGALQSDGGNNAS